MVSNRSDDSHLCDCLVHWKGKITITLPNRLSSHSAGGCSGRGGSRWADIRGGAQVEMRDGARELLASWQLPEGVPRAAREGTDPAGCRFVLEPSDDGILAQQHGYVLRIASHSIPVPRRHIAGNLFIDLPNRQHIELIKPKS